MKIKSISKKILAMFAAVVVLLCSIILGFSVKQTSTVFATATAISELWDGSAISKTNVDALFTALGGSATYQAVESYYNNSAKNYSVLSSKISTVTFGSQTWLPVYLSKDSSGNVVLTLWMRNSIGSSAFNTCANSSAYGEHPSGMYSTSEVRGKIMGTTGLNSDGTALVQQTQFSGLSIFTTTLSSYIDTPEQMTWQMGESSMLNDKDYDCSSSFTNATAQSKYNDWTSDVLWLPSDRELNCGIFGITHENAGAAFGSGDFWSRSAETWNDENYPWYYWYDGEEIMVQDSNSNTTCLVRPALHLNLSALNDAVNGSSQGGSEDTGVAANIVLPSILAVTFGTVLVMYTLTFKRKKRI